MTSSNALRWLLTVLSAGWISLAVAGYESRTITISMTVLNPPPCTINDGKTIEVDFGEITTTDLLLDATSRPINLNLSCSSMSKNQLRLQIQGTPDKDYPSYLLSSNGAVAIKFTSNGQVLPINSWLNFSWPDAPALRVATFYRKLNWAVQGGASFSASATLRVEYQ
ncbi:fimbrial protein [Erwinia aphidicola]|uniref:fimbrial protein n=1 Tax=Erwinia aphidicola TaxID=68334 RepID=UPI0030D10C12